MVHCGKVVHRGSCGMSMESSSQHPLFWPCVDCWTDLGREILGRRDAEPGRTESMTLRMCIRAAIALAACWDGVAVGEGIHRLVIQWMLRGSGSAEGSVTRHRNRRTDSV